jgi:hypothetical protein
MHNSSHRALHLREILRLTRIFDQPAYLDNLILIAVIFPHRLISASQPIPSLIGHRSIESVAKLQTDFFGHALFLSQLLESRKVSHLMSDEFHGAIGTVEVRPDRVAGVGVWSELSAFDMMDQHQARVWAVAVKTKNIPFLPVAPPQISLASRIVT